MWPDVKGELLPLREATGELRGEWRGDALREELPELLGETRLDRLQE